MMLVGFLSGFACVTILLLLLQDVENKAINDNKKREYNLKFIDVIFECKYIENILLIEKFYDRKKRKKNYKNVV